MHLQAGLDAVPRILEAGGRLVVISYHSLEDRLVKAWMDREAAHCICLRNCPYARVNTSRRCGSCVGA